MYLHPIEASDGILHGKFAVGRPGREEWSWRTAVPETSRFFEGLPDRPLLAQIGWGGIDVFVLDLQTCQGAVFTPVGSADNDVRKRQARRDIDRTGITVCPLFRPFLGWLYTQPLTNLSELPRYISLPVIRPSDPICEPMRT